MMVAQKEFYLLVLCSAMLLESAYPQEHKAITSDAIRQQEKLRLASLQRPEKPKLNMTLCADRCNADCKSYITPVSECYNSGDMFPNDPSWSAGLDVLDSVICQRLTRTIFQTSNGSCTTSDSDDRFLIPLEECVGPFGKPRPWGIFALISEQNQLALYC